MYSRFAINNRIQRRLVKSLEMKFLINRVISRLILLPRRIRAHAVLKTRSINFSGSSVRIVNRCVMTNRGRSIYRDYKLSRIKLRELSTQGLLAGMRKSSW